jgi:hypothetical protein
VSLARRFKANGKLSVNEREALESLGFDAAFPFLDLSTVQSIESGVEPPHSKGCRRFLMSKLNAIGFSKPG